MSHTFFTRGAVLMMLVSCMATSLPIAAQAQSRFDWEHYIEMYAARDTDDEDEDDDRSSRRRGISSSVQRKINQLGDDAVENLPIPILLGVTRNSLTRNFGDPRDGGSRSHEGLDIMASRGAYIVSPTDAVVIRTGKSSSAGTYVYTANPGDETFVYMHLDDIADGIKVGTVLKPGDLIGYVGNTGNAAGGPPHLHFEIRDGRRAEDPYPRLTGSFANKDLIRSLTAIVKLLQEELKDAR
ncbi:MAG TPA: M23 family metallopeptidase [Candidatus Paceibacterota bacterium]|nr:M23 family metallopeptidase [Candidatus Paceibacterota bacterium]